MVTESGPLVYYEKRKQFEVVYIVILRRILLKATLRVIVQTQIRTEKKLLQFYNYYNSD